MNKEQIEFNKTISMNKKQSIVKSCIWNDKDCSEKIIDAHSIQRGKILKAISDNGEIYHLGIMPSKDMNSMEPSFKTEGIKKFSTFNGFCGEHDKKIFQPIEDHSFTATEKQKNIYAYRAAAKEFHSNIESSELTKNLLGDKLLEDDLPNHLMATLSNVLDSSICVPDYIKEMMINDGKYTIIRNTHRNNKVNAAELIVICNYIKNKINNIDCLDLTHKYYSFDQEYPIACCSSFIPYFDFNGQQITNYAEVTDLPIPTIDNIINSKVVLLNIFPENGKTHILFSFFKSNKIFSNSVDYLLNQNNKNIKISLSNLVLNYVENIAFNPSYINEEFSDDEKNKMTSAYFNNILKTDVFTKININIFKDPLKVSEKGYFRGKTTSFSS